jgi:hypothetical protein
LGHQNLTQNLDQEGPDKKEIDYPCKRQMKLKVVSLFLLFLFSFVIAFPGYGNRSQSASKTQTIASDLSTNLPSLVIVLKKCLSKGINMIEEERNSEEDADSAPIVFDLPVNFTCSQEEMLFVHVGDYHHPEYNAEYKGIFAPPDCFIS